MRLRTSAFSALVALVAVSVVAIARPAGAAPVPPGFIDTVITSSLTAPTALAVAPDGRVFVTEQTGSVRVVKNGALLGPAFVTLSVDASGERGLIGITLDPNFAGNGFLYVYYTVPGSTSHNRVARFTASGDVAAANSQLNIVDLPDVDNSNHNGGGIHFAPDGTLLIGVGENGHSERSQDLSTPFGKILRVTALGAAPSNNPFFSTPGADQRVWALGLRNPYTFNLQPGTGRIYINDVGATSWEEIDEAFAAGMNFGWPITEGPTSDSRFASPRFAYQHGTGETTGCAITGGVFYNPPISQFPADYSGDYFFSDLCSGWIRRLDVATGTVASFVPAGGVDGPVDLASGPDGALYYVAHGGSLGRITSTQHWYLRTSNTPGTPNLSFVTGPSGGQSLACDWDGTGGSTPGTFLNGSWYLWNNTSGGPPSGVFAYGSPGDRAICGDWDGNGTDTIGVFQNGHFYLRNTNGAGSPSTDVRYGTPGDPAIAGDWDGNGTDTIGVQEFGHLYLRNTNTPGPPNFDIAYGTPNDVPLAGDWDDNGTDTIGVYQFNHFYLRNSNAPGVPDIDVFYGGPSNRPVTGDWDGNGSDTIGVVE
ncbi:MAG: hypothetical protein QOD92_2568 [Acidimicrobiaceae bacterium]|jgi:glucose/arabinose dehydrogenase